MNIRVLNFEFRIWIFAPVLVSRPRPNSTTFENYYFLNRLTDFLFLISLPHYISIYIHIYIFKSVLYARLPNNRSLSQELPQSLYDARVAVCPKVGAQSRLCAILVMRSLGYAQSWLCAVTVAYNKYLHIYIYICLYLYIYIYIKKIIYKHIHIYKHIYIYTKSIWLLYICLYVYNIIIDIYL